MDENSEEVRELTRQLVDAQTSHQVDLIDMKLAVLRKYQQ